MSKQKKQNILEGILFILIAGIFPFQFLMLFLNTHVCCIIYSGILLLTAILVKKCRATETSELAVDKETGFLSRTVFDIQSTSAEDLTYLIYIRIPILEDFTLRHGLMAEQEAMEKLADLVLYAFKDISYRLYRYGDQSLVITSKSKNELSTMVTFVSSAVRKIYHYAIPLPEFSEELRVPLHVGILETATIQASDRLRYLEYAKFPTLALGQEAGPSVRVFNKEQYDNHMSLLFRQTHIPDVIYDEEVSIVFQPIQNCKTGELFGYEALSRPTSPHFKHIGELLSDADKSGHYINMELCLTSTAIDTYKEKRKDTNLRLFLNFAPETITSRVYTSAINSGVFSGVPYVFEIVERGEVLPDVVQILRELTTKVDGVVALDDFGTGYSNHLALLNAKPNIIKVSRELLMGIDKDHDKQQVYSNIVMFAYNVQTEVLAEGIETEEEYQTLLRLGMDYAQGFFIGRPNADLINVSDRSKELCKEYANI